MGLSDLIVSEQKSVSSRSSSWGNEDHGKLALLGDLPQSGPIPKMRVSLSLLISEQ